LSRKVKASVGTCVNVMLGEPESLRQVVQKQIVVLLGGAADVYDTRPQAHEP
jgi:hypothetical protein